MSDDARDGAEQRTLLMPRREQGSELPRGFALQEFVVDKVLGVGSGGIVYLAQDTRLGRRPRHERRTARTLFTQARMRLGHRDDQRMIDNARAIAGRAQLRRYTSVLR